MSHEVRDSYDLMARKYAELFLGDLDGDPYARQWLDVFAERAASSGGVIADLGCGPGHVAKYLTERGLPMVGYDLSPGQIAEARQASPDLQFEVANLAALENPDASLGGLVSRYSLIHIPPSQLDHVFDEWVRVLEPHAPVLLSFYGSLDADAHGTPFDHAVVTAYELFPEIIANQMQQAGFTGVEIGRRDPPKDGRPFEQATLLAARFAS